MPRRSMFGQAEAMRDPAPRLHQRDRFMAMIAHRREMTPGAEDERRFLDEADESPSVGGAAHRIACGEEQRRLARPQREEIADDEAGESPALCEADAAADRRIIEA